MKLQSSVVVLGSMWFAFACQPGVGPTSGAETAARQSHDPSYLDASIRSLACTLPEEQDTAAVPGDVAPCDQAAVAMVRNSHREASAEGTKIDRTKWASGIGPGWYLCTVQRSGERSRTWLLDLRRFATADVERLKNSATRFAMENYGFVCFEKL